MKYSKYLKRLITLAVLVFLLGESIIIAQNKIYLDDKNNVIKENLVDNMKIAITFDDGPHPKETDKILDILKKYDAKATFFVVGKHVNWYTNPMIRASKEGHEIANHTYTHPDISDLSIEQIKKEIKDCEDIIVEKTGSKPRLFRPPFGKYNDKALEEISKELGYTIILWSGVDAKDWKNPQPYEIANKIISSAKPGEIILLHDYGTNNTVQALDLILSSLKQKGYKFVTVSELLEN